MSTISQSFLDFFKEDLNNGCIPELYIDERIFNVEQTNIDCPGKVYFINDDRFYEMRDSNDLKEFTIVNKNEYEVDIEVNSHGIIINSIVLLSLHQWHTITDGTRCLVCNMTVQDPDGHIILESHTKKLNEHKPLKKFDLHITRKIGDNYFCAVCNELYNMRYEDKHVESEGHLEKMLYATNRAIDVTNDSRCQDVNSDTVSHDTNFGLETESGFDSANTDLNDTASGKNFRSYAMVARQQPLPTPFPFIEHVVGIKKFLVPYDRYHMVLRLNDQVYCMICIQFFYYKKKNEHCESLGHMVKLKCCEVFDIDGHFVRRVTTKFHHCGSCNNLVISFDLKSHLLKHDTHNIFLTKDTIRPNDGITNTNNDVFKCNIVNINNNIPVQINIKPNYNPTAHMKVCANRNNDVPNTHMNIANTDNEKPAPNQVHVAGNVNIGMPVTKQINNINPNINNDIIINRFNCNIRVSFSSYNFVIKRSIDYVCVLCNYCNPDMRVHIADLRHIIYLQNTHFEPFFGINLIRMVYQGAHCAICNVVVKIELIHTHVINQMHVYLLHTAMSQGTYHYMNTTMNQSINKPASGPSVTITPKNNPTNNVKQCNERKDKNVKGLSTGTVKTDSNQTDNIKTNNGGVTTIETKNQTVQTDTSDKSNTGSTVDGKIVEKVIRRTNEDVLTNYLQDGEELIDNLERDAKILDEYIYLRNKNDIIKVSYASFHGLIAMGHGKKYCFLCTTEVDFIKFHIQSIKHIERLTERKFIISCQKDLLRQVMLTYHCCICNVIFQKSEMNNHLKWPTHLERSKWEQHSDRQTDIDVVTIYYKEEETGFDASYREEEIKIIMNFKTGNIPYDSLAGIFLCVNKKLVSISWEAFNGLSKIKNRLYCNLCLDSYLDEESHLEEEKHKKALKLPLETQYLPSCLRQVNTAILNCVTCNINIPNVKRNITEHLNGKRHSENYDCVMRGAFTIS